MTLFARILEIFFPPRDHEAIVRRSSPETLTALVAPETFTIDGIQITSLLPYRAGMIKAFIREAKFHGNEYAQRSLGVVLAHYLRDVVGSSATNENNAVIVVPIPLSAKRRKERGYNQAERIATFATRSPSAGISMETGLLVRTRDTVPQTSLAKGQRISNMQGAFTTTRAASTTHTYIVFDDVSTTGATLLSAYSALHEAGATSILLLALAH